MKITEAGLNIPRQRLLNQHIAQPGFKGPAEAEERAAPAAARQYGQFLQRPVVLVQA